MKRYRLFGKIPVADILVVGLLLAVSVGAVWLLTRGQVREETGAEAQGEQRYPFTATLLVADSAAENEALIAVGDKLYIKGGTYIGEVTGVRSAPAVQYGYNLTDGKAVATELSGQKNFYITVKGEGTAYSDKGLFIGSKRIAYNASHSFGNEKYFWSMRIIDVKMEGKQ